MGAIDHPGASAMTDPMTEIFPDWLDEIEGIVTRGEIEPSRSAASESKVVYHYTPADGLRGIISNHLLWATDVEFLNDAQELTYAGEGLLSALKQERSAVSLREQLVAGYIDDEKIAHELAAREERRENWGCHVDAGADDWDSLLEALDVIIEGLGQMRGPSRNSPLHVYVSCFCQNGDLLSQWRGYGGVGGYSIGFKAKALRNIAMQREKGEFHEIYYGFNEAAKFNPTEFFPSHLRPDLSLMGDYLRALTMIKNPAFREEREWRLMIPREEMRDDVEFRVSPVGVTPYIQVAFLPDAVTEVIVGPGQHHAERMYGTRQLLDRFDMNHVRVVPSHTSLRL
ncbi:hypothetical protein GCM10010218_12930 [Streptomyces mashuensis]|uniref:DUF2971 domain-containing protein n=1 Tax=Streptomyces mashuensis TaxID=33904 RepID=A0A919EBD6_9ACTN|nr:DUF2971 domain-containing protein [Streptomyces mashuensis]GHF33251.1 hypothetical protein GCM10010218_12930 [Streptomyces mashuensis]